MRKSHCPPEGLGRLCRRPGDVLGRELSLTLRTSRFQTLPGSLWGPLGSISESLQLPKMMNFERLSAPFRVRCSLRVLTVCGTCFHPVFCVFWPRAHKGQMRKLTHSPCENLFFQGTRRRRARHREGNRRPKTAAKVDATRPLEMPKHCDFPGSRGRPSKYVPK